jgi:Rieske Fe-S protein
MHSKRVRWSWLVFVLLLGLVGMVGASVLAVPAPAARLAIKTAGLPAVSAHPIPPGMSVQPTSTGTRPAMVLLVRDGETWRAFADRSTHRGEPVVWREESSRFVDPYSGAMWDTAGRPVAGPAPRGLDWYPVTREGDYVIVDLIHPRPGGRD